MSTILDRALPCLYLAMTVLPIAAMGLHDRKIEGALPEAPAPVLGLSSVVREDYQRDFTRAFESELGLKGWEIALDNTILYHAFHETKWGSRVRLGQRGVLFVDEDIDFYNRDAPNDADERGISELADAIADLQQKLAKKHRALVPVIIPSKTTVYEDAISPSWVRRRESPRPSRQIYDAMVRALDRRGIVYVDARAMFVSGGIPRERLWSPDARHWSDYGACLAMAKITIAAGALGARTAPYDCMPRQVQAPREHSDRDLWRLLNVLGTSPAATTVSLVTHPLPSAVESKPSVLFVSSSFGWMLLKDSNASGAFASVRMDYYDKTYVEWPEDRYSEVVPHGARWRETFEGKDLYVLDLLETYLPPSYVLAFVRAMMADVDLTP